MALRIEIAQGAGLPTFILGRKVGVSGAQPPEALAAAIRGAATS